MAYEIKRIEWKYDKGDRPKVHILVDGGHQFSCGSEQNYLFRGTDVVSLHGLPAGTQAELPPDEHGEVKVLSGFTDDPNLVAAVSEFCHATKSGEFEPKIVSF